MLKFPGLFLRLKDSNIKLYIGFGMVVAILLYLVVVPLSVLVWGSLKSIRPGEPGFFSLDVTISNYVRAITEGPFFTAAFNTFLYAVGTVIVTFLLATFLAWLTERTDVPMRSLIYGLSLMNLVIPGVLTALAWVFIMSPNIGVLNVIGRSLGLTKPLFNIYSFAGMIWTTAWQFLPLAFLLLSAAFHSMDPSLEEAAMLSRAGVVRTFFRVTLPISLPSLMAVLILLFIYAVELFETPALLGFGSQPKILVFSTLVFLNTQYAPSDTGLASAYAVILLAICMVGVVVYMRVTSREYRFMSITGKGFRPRRIPLRKWRWPISALALFLLAVGIGFPMLVLCWASLLRFFQVPSTTALGSLTLANWQIMGQSNIVRWALKNSLILGPVSATFTVILVAIVVWIVAKTRVPGRKLLDFLTFAPIAIPGVVLAISMIWLYLSIPVPIYGTLVILIIAYITKYMPVVARIMSASMMQIHSEMEEAASVCGLGWLQTFTGIVLPLLKPGLFASWIWVTSHAFREVSISIMLSNQQTRPVGAGMMTLWLDGSFGTLSSFGILVSFIILILAIVAKIVGSRYGLRSY